MRSEKHSSSTARNSDTTDNVSRRHVIKATSAAAVGATGLAVTAGSASAQWFGGGSDIPELDLRGDIPGIDLAPQGEDEVVFNVHGYSGSSASVSQAAQLQSTAEDLGYDTSYVAVTWDDGGGPTGALSGARDAGDRFASWLDDYLAANPQTSVRVLGHSMGGIVTMETLAGIDGHFKIENADAIGSYEASDGPCDEFYDAIVDSCVRAYNYHSSNDSIARLGQDGASCGGFFGGGDTPDNYYDVDVTSSVFGHTSYKSSEGCVGQIVDNWQDTPSESRDPADLGDNIDYDSGIGGGGGGWFGWF